MASNDVTLQIGIETRNALNQISKFQSEATKSVSNISNAFDGLKKVAIAAVGIFAARSVINGINNVIDAASRQEDAVNSLNQALKASGEFSEEASKDFQNFASSIQQVTKFGDEAILEQAAYAKSIGLTNEQTKLAIEASVQLAAAQKISLSEATDKVAKSFIGLGGPLGRTNAQIKNLTQEQLKSGEAAKILLAQFSGSAEAEILTYSGATQQLSNSYGDLLEKFGKFIIESPLVINSINNISKALNEFGAIIEDNEDSINGSINGIISFGLELTNLVASAIGFAIKSFLALQTAIEFITSKIFGLISSFFEFSKISPILNKLGVDTKGLGQAFKTLEFQSKRASDQTLKNFATVENTVGTVNSFITKLNKKTTSEIKKSFQETTAAAGKARSAQTEEAKKAAQSIIDEYSKIQKEFENFGLNEVGIAVKTADQKIEVVKNAIKERVLAEKEGAKLIAAIEQDLANKTSAIKQKEAEGKKEEEGPSGLSSLLSTAGSLISGIIEGFKIGANIFRSIFSGDIINQATDFINSFVSLTGDKLAVIIDGLQMAIARIPNFFADIVPRLLEALPAILGLVVAALESIVVGIFDSLASIINKIPELVNVILKALPRVLQRILKAIPGIIKAIAVALPIVIRQLADALPGIIEVLAENIGPIVEALVEGILVAVPTIVFSLVDSLIFKGGIFRIVGSLVKGLANSIGGAFTGIFKALAGVFSGAIKFPKIDFSGFSLAISKFFNAILNLPITIADAIIKALGLKKGTGPGTTAQIFSTDFDVGISNLLGGAKRKSILGFAEGGLVPSGFPNDTFPARLTSGEQVIDRTDNKRLSRFLDSQEKSTPQIININLKVGESELAKVLFNLNRQGFRTA